MYSACFLVLRHEMVKILKISDYCWIYHYARVSIHFKHFNKVYWPKFDYWTLPKLQKRINFSQLRDFKKDTIIALHIGGMLYKEIACDVLTVTLTCRSNRVSYCKAEYIWNCQEHQVFAIFFTKKKKIRQRFQTLKCLQLPFLLFKLIITRAVWGFLASIV